LSFRLSKDRKLGQERYSLVNTFLFSKTSCRWQR